MFNYAFSRAAELICVCCSTTCTVLHSIQSPTSELCLSKHESWSMLQECVVGRAEPEPRIAKLRPKEKGCGPLYPPVRRPLFKARLGRPLLKARLRGSL